MTSGVRRRTPSRWPQFLTWRRANATLVNPGDPSRRARWRCALPGQLGGSWKRGCARRAEQVGTVARRCDVNSRRPHGDGVLLRDGPFGEAKELIGGYFFVNARDYTEAARLAEEWPHLTLGGTTALREIEPT